MHVWCITKNSAYKGTRGDREDTVLLSNVQWSYSEEALLLLLMTTALVLCAYAFNQSGSSDLAKMTEALVVKEPLCLGAFLSTWKPQYVVRPLSMGCPRDPAWESQKMEWCTEYSLQVFKWNIWINVTGSEKMSYLDGGVRYKLRGTGSK